MTPDRFISLAELKKKCGLPPGATDLDVQMGIYRDTAIAKIESRTRRHIVDKSVTIQSPSGGDGLDCIVFHVHDAKLPDPDPEGDRFLIVKYRTDQATPGFQRDGELKIPIELCDFRKDRVLVFNGDSSGAKSWPARDTMIPYQADFNVGIPGDDSSNESPPEFISACLMIVAELQAGSLMDSLPKGILDLILRDHVKPNLTAADEEMAEAGVG